MRTYGKKDGRWVVIDDEEQVWTTTLIQCLRLGLNESPFFANYGLPLQDITSNISLMFYHLENLKSKFRNRFKSIELTSNGVADINISISLYSGNRPDLEY